MVKMKEVFSLYDRNSDGVISTSEITAIMKQLGHNPSEAEIRGIIMKEVDPNGNGTIDFTGILKSNLDILPLMVQIFYR